MSAPTNPYQNPRIGGVITWWFWLGLRYITNAYQPADLARILAQNTITNHYRLGLNTHMTEHDKWDRISLWTLRAVVALAVLVMWLVVTGRIDAWLG